MIAYVLYRAFIKGMLKGEAQLETAGRIAFALKKYLTDRSNASALQSLTELGQAFRRDVVACGDGLAAATEQLRSELDLSGQVYEFDLECFSRHNCRVKLEGSNGRSGLDQ
jgi:hypothetical protein